jgi:hypothetical protein
MLPARDLPSLAREAAIGREGAVPFFSRPSGSTIHFHPGPPASMLWRTIFAVTAEPSSQPPGSQTSPANRRDFLY